MGFLKFSRALPSALLFFLLALPAAHGSAAAAGEPWQDLEAGLQLGRFTTPDGGASIDALRIDPAFFRFSLHSAGVPGSMPRTLTEWAEQEDLTLAVNAGMYLPDRKTSTGYARFGSYVNNPRVHNKFGAFFVAEPAGPDLPQAAVLDRERDPWEELLPRYALVIQNYRLIDADGRALWLSDGSRHSSAAVGQDAGGRILFIHCRTPLNGQEFASALLRLPLGLRALMYVEGGAQAGMLVRSPGMRRLWSGYSVMSFLTLNEKNAFPLPNVLGARRRQGETPENKNSNNSYLLPSEHTLSFPNAAQRP